jgi:hypothetical protein
VDSLDDQASEQVGSGRIAGSGDLHSPGDRLLSRISSPRKIETQQVNAVFVVGENADFDNQSSRLSNWIKWL